MRRIPSPIRWCIAIVAGLLTLPVAYALSALILGLVPVNRDWKPAANGITIWLTTNGVHAGFALPAEDPAMDWAQVFPRGDARAPRASRPGDVVYIGWGDRTFFLNVPTWADLTFSTAAYALSGLDGTAVHVEYGAPPVEGAQARRLVVTHEQYQRLIAYIRASVVADTRGRAAWITSHAYGDQDAFYEGTGRYSLFVTCNQWTRDALSVSGIRTAAWSPFDRPLFHQVDEAMKPPPLRQ